MNKSGEKGYFFSDKPLWRTILELFCGSRLLLLLTGWFSAYYQGNVIYQRYLDQGYFLSPKWWIDIWCRWDSEWQLSIVKWGYVASEDLSSRSGHLSAWELIVQGIATSIDALSVGFTIASYAAFTAVTSSLIIGVVTLFICIAGLLLGRQIGTRLAGKASVLGGVILIAIGIEIWVKGVFL